MGWASGSELARDLWNEVRKVVPKKQRKELAQYFIDKFENEDCDTIEECDILIKDAGWEECYYCECLRPDLNSDKKCEFCVEEYTE